MKKLIVTLSAVVIGFAASAATVDWQYKVTKSAGTEGYNDGYSIYLFDANVWASEVAAGLSEDTWGKALDSTSFKYTAGRTAGDGTYQTFKSGSTTAAGARAVNLSDEVVGSGDTLNAMYVILNNNKNPSEYYAEATTLTGRKSTDTQITTGFGTSTAADLGSATWTKTSGGGAVPEPTSGLLLLLGMAGLALRRKLV